MFRGSMALNILVVVVGCVCVCARVNMGAFMRCLGWVTSLEVFGWPLCENRLEGLYLIYQSSSSATRQGCKGFWDLNLETHEPATTRFVSPSSQEICE